MNPVEHSLLGRDTAYPTRYAPELLHPIPRALGRADIGVGEMLPFHGVDVWNAYELSWLDLKGKPVVATARFSVPADSPNLIESKSFKLYLNSLNGERFVDAEAARARMLADLSKAAGAPLTMAFDVADAVVTTDGACIDGIDVEITSYGPPDARLLHAHDDIVEEVLVSHLLKSNCPVTTQPDWATLTIDYRGPRLDRAALLRYVVSFRDHCEFHEQCVERIFTDLQAQCAPERLSVLARYTRRGGLDINPWRGSLNVSATAFGRDVRQ